MRWPLPEWVLPANEVFYKYYKDRGRLYSMTEPEYAVACKYLSKKRTALDIGAHIGTTALRYAQDFDLVCAFEPVYYDALQENVGHANNIQIYPVAVSNREGYCALKRSAKNSGATVIVIPENERALKTSRFDQREISAPCIAIDSLNLADVDFVKMDTEGFVLPVLEGMKQTLANSFPLLQIEFNNMTVNERGCLRFLDDLGYNQCDRYADVDRYYKRKIS